MRVLTEQDHALLQSLLRGLRRGGFNFSPMGITPPGAAVNSARATAFRYPLLWVKITANETGGGKYQAKSYTLDGTTDVAATGNVAESELGTLSATVDCRVLNFAEEGESTHDLTAGTPEIDTFLCHHFHTNSDGIKVCAVVAYDRETCS